ncbi:UDP-glucose 4-epimerase-like protein [Planctomycetota bacterium]|nr:UDP-glucose 4-epimerase-like protein [Planctomycetota bacterium]
MSDRILVTGGGGFIGSHLVRALLARGSCVTVLDNFATGKRENLTGLAGDLVVIEGSVVAAEQVAQAMQNVRAVAHLAALPSVPRSIERPIDSHEACATGTAQVLFAAQKQRARVVYAGSSSAYGNQSEQWKHEAMREDPLSPYAAAKLAGELYCRSFARVYQLPVVVTRFFNVFGPRQTPDSQYSGVIAAFCYALLKNQAPRIHGDGLQSRDFTYVEDVVFGVMLALDATTQGCEIINLAYGQTCTVMDLFRQLRRIAGSDLEPVHVPARTGDVSHSLANVDRAKSVLGFFPRVGFAEGLTRTYEWYRSQNL